MTSVFRLRSPAARGALLALASAALFGLSTPFVQRFGVAIGPFSTAALLYLGAACVAALTMKPSTREAALRKSDLPRLMGMAAMGAVIGPVALAWGLQRSSGASASLMLTLEAVFTALLAWAWYGEAMDKRVALAMLLLLAGGAALVLDQGMAGQGATLGLLAVLLATAAWGVDNALSRGVADRDPGQVVGVKSILGVTATLALAALAGEGLPPLSAALALLVVGATGYGLSLRLYVLAQRAFGASRTGSVYAFAPFVGLLGAFALGERSLSLMVLLAGALMLGGVWLHVSESHEHEHKHAALAHEHAHVHGGADDDGHHSHPHDPSASGPHSHNHNHNHWHQHEPVQHSHPHVPDAHHLHRH